MSKSSNREPIEDDDDFITPYEYDCECGYSRMEHRSHGNLYCPLCGRLLRRVYPDGRRE